jgi:hypothetical protein
LNKQSSAQAENGAARKNISSEKLGAEQMQRGDTKIVVGDELKPYD